MASNSSFISILDTSGAAVELVGGGSDGGSQTSTEEEDFANKWRRDVQTARLQGQADVYRDRREMQARNMGKLTAAQIEALVTDDSADGARSKILEDAAYERGSAQRSFDRDARGAREEFGSRIANVSAQIADEKKGLADAGTAYRSFMDSITPGFSDAVAQAEKAAAASAAIEQVFDENQEAIDQTYAGASGRVRAISDKVAGSNEQVAQALSETIYEMKGFIDKQNGLNRSQTLAMHSIASQLAAASAEADLARHGGAATRDTFEAQSKYEKIITDLIRQRSALNASRERALRDVEEAREEWKAGDDRRLKERLEGVDDADYRAFTNTASVEAFEDAGMTLLFKDWRENGDGQFQLNKSDETLAYDMMLFMRDRREKDFGTFLLKITEHPDVQGDPQAAADMLGITRQQLERLPSLEDEIEVGRLHLEGLEVFYNGEMTGNPTSTWGMYSSQFNELVEVGVDPKAAHQTVIERLRDLGVLPNVKG